MPAGHLVLGLDGADLSLIRELGPLRLPTLHRLMAEGAYAALESVQPPATLPNWTTFLTGADPGVHGVFDFTRRHGYEVRFSAGTVRRTETIAARLDRRGRSCAVVGFPGTWPPEHLDCGVFISGWDAPVAFEADQSFVHPRWLHEEIVARFGAQRFDDVDEFRADRRGWHEALPAALASRVARRTELGRWLLRQRHWDLFALYFGESDTAAHHLWSLHDSSSPRHRPGCEDGLADVYGALDQAVGELLSEAGEAELTIVSDHGSGGASDKVLYLNRALAEAGLLTFAERSPIATAAGAIKSAALRVLPRRAQESLFAAGGRVLPSLLESRARFGAIDFGGTRAFSDELNYFPSVHLNLAGREPRGLVQPSERTAVLGEVTAALRALRDPWTGRPIVRRALRREELFDGPEVKHAPDLLLELFLDEVSPGRSYSYNLMPSGTAPPGTGPFRRLAPEEHLGRKGRSLAGSHRPRGLMVLAGPSIAPVGEVDAHIADATATLLARMGVAVPADAMGRVLWETLSQHATTEATELGPAHPRPAASRGQEGVVMRRLRALGYVD